MLTIYVAEKSLHEYGIAAGSGIVGQPQPQGGMVIIYYEGNQIRANNLHSYDARVKCAAGRMIFRKPTSSLGALPANQLVAVGKYDPSTHNCLYDPKNSELLERWKSQYPIAV